MLVTGCVPSTVDGLRQGAAGREVFEVHENYQAVYRTVLDQARKCHQGGSITAQRVVQGNLYPDQRGGHVVVALHDSLGVETLLAVDITALDEKRSRLTTYYALSNWKSRAQAVEKWVTEGYKHC